MQGPVETQYEPRPAHPRRAPHRKAHDFPEAAIRPLALLVVVHMNASMSPIRSLSLRHAFGSR